MQDISIIMPLYNAEKYLEEAICSLLKQSFHNFELLCINDCSTDKTRIILEKLKLKDNRIRIFDNATRQGAAMSRNQGIKEAKGKYLLFLDGDDIFDKDLLKETFKKIESTNADIVLYNYMHVDSKDIYKEKVIKHGAKYVSRYCKNIFSVRELDPHEFLVFSGATCNKLYRKGLIDSYNTRFQNLESANDVYFSFKLLLLSEKTIILDDERVMVYARDHNGPYRISKYRDPMCAYSAIEYLLNDLVANKEVDKLINHYFYMAVYLLKGELIRHRFTETGQRFYNFLHKEGIIRLCELAGETYNGVNEDIRAELQSFINNTYQFKSFEMGNILDIYLHKNEEDVIQLIQVYKLSNKKIGVWGAGRNGISFLAFCKRHEINVDLIVDIDDSKEGTIIYDYKVSSLQCIDNTIDIFFVVTAGVLESVKEFIDKTGFDIELLDINMIVGIY